ncbi:MAG TPA: lamin tail domain-containing protein, partial [Afifellaceae bacterium]|nr:lamin tail domain-containing protein [Afifellaceae bacterium]
EVLNTGTAAVDMQGWTVRDEGSNAFTIQDSVVLAAGRFAILARSQTAAGGSAAYVYGSAMSLANSADQIIIERDGELVDAVAYDASFPLAAGASMELAASATDVAANDSPANWCEAQSQMADGDRGSPGAAGPGCAGIQ